MYDVFFFSGRRFARLTTAAVDFSSNLQEGISQRLVALRLVADDGQHRQVLLVIGRILAAFYLAAFFLALFAAPVIKAVKEGVVEAA